MSDWELLSPNRAAEMRDAFNRSFAEARPPELPPEEDLLALRIGAEPYALRLSEIAGLFADRKITPLPGGVPALLGIAGFRGAIVPVYDLSALLGHPPNDTVHWLAMATGEAVAVAFATLDGHLRIARDAILPFDATGSRRPHIRHFARTPDLVRPIVHLPSAIEAIRGQVSTNVETRRAE